jgi:hypothetical protein
MVYVGNRQSGLLAVARKPTPVSMGLPPRDETEKAFVAAAAYTVLLMMDLRMIEQANQICKDLEALFQPILPMRILRYAVNVVRDQLDAGMAERRLLEFFTEEEQKNSSVRLIYLSLVTVDQAKLGIVNKAKISAAVEELRIIAQGPDEGEATRARALLESVSAN